jgi:pyruvate,orthophosphate dikinase
VSEDRRVQVRAITSLGPGDRAELGDKAVLLARAAALGLRVPPGFVIAPSLVARLVHGEGREEVRAAIADLEAAEGARLGEGLCVAVRPSSDQSQPGGHPTILDVGASRGALASLEERLGDRSAAVDARLRFLRALARARGVGAARPAVRGVRGGPSPSAEASEAEVVQLEAQLGLAQRDAEHELFVAIEAVAGDALPIVVQAMRFGTSRRGVSGAGAASSRHPITGEPVVFGEIAWERQGEDVSLGRGAGVSLRRAAAGRRGEESLEARAPEILNELSRALADAERSLDEVADLEIAIEAGVLWVLQLRATVLTPRAEVRTLVDRAEEGTLAREEAIARVRLASMARVGRVELVPEEELPGGSASILGRGLGASPGAATGRVAIGVDDAVTRSARGERVVLVRSDASPEDAPAVRAAVAVATASGGLTSHAAVMSRALGRPCAVSVSSLSVRGEEVVVAGPSQRRLVAGDVVTVDGTRGLLVLGAAPTRWVADDAAPGTLAEWARVLSPVRVLVPADGGDPGGQAHALRADGVWNGRTAIDLSGVERPEWGPAAPWDAAEQRFPSSELVVVPAVLVAAARVAAAVTAIAGART